MFAFAKLTPKLVTAPLAAILIAACGAPPSTAPGPVASITLTPAESTLVINTTQRYVATGKDATGKEVSISPTWHVIAGGGTVDSSGLFTAGARSGSFDGTISASVGGICGYASVTVINGPLASVVVTPNSAALAIGATQQFAATGKDAAGNAVALTTTWSIVAGGGTIDTSGLLTAGTAAGTYSNTVKATSAGISGFASLTVAAGALAAIHLTPGSASLEVGTDKHFTAEGQDAHNNVLSIFPAWSVAAGGGTITTAGTFTAGTLAGTYANTIKATVGALSGFASVTVTPGPLAAIAISPSAHFMAIGDTKPFTATGADAHGNAVTIFPTWSAAAGGTITTAGVFTAGTVSGLFTNAVKATSTGVNGYASVTISAGALSTIVLTPSSVALQLDAAQQFQAAGKDSHGNTVAMTPVWSVVANGGTITSGGLFTAGRAAGTFTSTVKATSGAVFGLASVTVQAGALATITLTPASVTLAANTTQLFASLGRDAYGNAVAISPTWTALSGGGINNVGFFTAGSSTGTFTNAVRAKDSGISGFASVTVTGPLTAIAITSPSATMAQNSTLQFTAVGTDADGNTVSLTPIWSVVADGGSIDQQGLFTSGTESGTFTDTVRAVSGTVSSHATVTVTAGALSAIAVTPAAMTLAQNVSQQMTALGTDANGNEVALTPAWSVEAGGGAIGSISGLFIAGTAAGTFTNTIRATSGGISGFASVTVGAGALATITISGQELSLEVGTNRQLIATGRDADGNIVPISPHWSVMQGGGTIDSVTGLFTAGSVAGTFTDTVKANGGPIAGFATMTLTHAPPPGLAVNLGTAKNFVILAKSAVATVPTSAVTGDVGVSPAAASFITGFSLTADSTNVFSTSPQVTGKIYAADYTPPTPSNMTTAVGDMQLAFTDAAGRAPSATELGAGNISGMTLAAGVYKWGTGLLIATDVTLSGSPTDVWIFQIGQDLTVSSGAKVLLAGGAMAKNIFWQVAGLVDLGTTAHHEGIILSQTSITLRTGATINGRLLAQTAVNIDGSTVVQPAE